MRYDRTTKLLLNELLDSGSHAYAEDSALAKISLALCGLQTEVVAVLRVVHLYLAAGGNVKSLCRRFMCLNLSHFTFSFL